MEQISIEKQQEIESLFKEQLKGMGITNSSSKTALKLQHFYFNGATAVLGSIPPLWGVCMMSGRSIIEERARHEREQV